MDEKRTEQEEPQSKLQAFYHTKWLEASQEDLPDEIRTRMLKRIRRRIKTRLWMPYAAAVAALISVGLASHLYTLKYMGETTDSQTEQLTFTVSADKGQRANLTLPDGSRVWLNSHSQIIYPANYGRSERSLVLTGEAYFEVAPDSAHRFVVQAGEMAVEALGTAFNIKAYAEDKEVIATLFSGSVRTTAGDFAQKLAPEDYASFNRLNGQLTVAHAENAAYASMWRDNELAFERQTMNEIAVLLNRMYNVEIVFQSDKIRNYRFSGVIKNNSLDNVIELISLTAPITYRSVGDTIILNEKNF
ncbi:MAG: DUF4974 domain-containing protein [Tannerellaceae bacterium]|jgi:ferric-dicitrate binding protein FerR (iron transport regulator)|nr:DUF4974 domain-containing protein [Tannerellaceae bacterium]